MGAFGGGANVLACCDNVVSLTPRRNAGGNDVDAVRAQPAGEPPDRARWLDAHAERAHWDPERRDLVGWRLTVSAAVATDAFAYVTRDDIARASYTGTS